MKGQESRSRFGPDLLHKGPEDRVTALIARLFDPLENLLGRIIMLFQQGDDLAFERIEFAGALGDRGSLVALPSRPLAHRVQTQFELASDLAQAQPLLDEQVPNLAIGLVIDHG